MLVSVDERKAGETASLLISTPGLPARKVYNHNMNGRFSEEPQTKVFNINAAIHAPFDGLDETELEDKVIAFIKESGLDDDQRYFLKAGFIAQGDDAFASDSADGPRGLFLTKEEQDCLIEEKTRRWKHPGALWRLVALCALGAAVQGWDEAAVDGGMILQQCCDFGTGRLIQC